MGRKGVEAVMAEAVGTAAKELETLRGCGGEALDLFSLPMRSDPDERQRERVAAVQAERQAEARKGGRPQGATNKATAAFREYLLRRGVSPLEQIMRWSMHTPETLAAELGCSKADAFDRLVRLWSELAPYLHSRMAPSDGTGAVAPMLNIQLGGGAPGAPRGPDVPPWIYDGVAQDLEAEGEQNQGVSGSAPDASHGNASHD